MDYTANNEIFFDQNPFAELFEVTPYGSSAKNSITGIYDNQDNPVAVFDTSVANDAPNVDFKSSDVTTYSIAKKTKIKRIATGDIYYALDLTPDVDGIKTVKLSKDIPQ